jgi:hypothetical protein
MDVDLKTMRRNSDIYLAAQRVVWTLQNGEIANNRFSPRRLPVTDAEIDLVAATAREILKEQTAGDDMPRLKIGKINVSPETEKKL